MVANELSWRSGWIEQKIVDELSQAANMGLEKKKKSAPDSPTEFNPEACEERLVHLSSSFPGWEIGECSPRLSSEGAKGLATVVRLANSWVA